MRIYQLCFGLVLIAALVAGCTPSKQLQGEEKKKQDPSKEKVIRLSDYEATLNPVDFDREIEAAQKTGKKEQKLPAPLEIPKDSMAVQEEVVQGFRIQIFSSSNVDEASSMKNLAIEKFSSDSIYVVYDAPVYKVRIGDFTNRYEANQRLPEFIEKGYRDAWIVPDRIIQRKLVRVFISK